MPSPPPVFEVHRMRHGFLRGDSFGRHTTCIEVAQSPMWLSAGYGAVHWGCSGSGWACGCALEIRYRVRVYARGNHYITTHDERSRDTLAYTSMVVAALFVDPKGCYSELDGVDMWPEERDARKYSGPHPVVAHPPCNVWCRLAKLIHFKLRTEKTIPGNDGGCFASALESVNKYGGVLEHPCGSLAWRWHGLRPPPPKPGWYRSGQGWTCRVWQSAYGHPANKSTWLYYRGKQRPFQLNWSTPVTTHQLAGSWKDRTTNRPRIPKGTSIATPKAFRDTLLRLSLHSTIAPAKATPLVRDRHCNNCDKRTKRTRQTTLFETL